MRLLKNILLVLLLLGFAFAATVDQARINQEIKKSLKTHLYESYGKCDLSVLNHPQVSFPYTSYDIQVVVPEKVVGITTVGVNLVHGDYQKELQYLVNVRIKGDVVVTSGPVGRKIRLSEANLKVVKKDITGLIHSNQEYYTELSQIGDLRSRHYLKEGEIVTPAKVEARPDVLAHVTMKLLAQQSNIAVKVAVKTLEEGFIGDVIKVMSPKYKKVLLAKIINTEEVLLLN